MGGDTRRLCHHYWISSPIQAEFYYQCLQKFDIEGFAKIGRFTIRSMRDLSIELRDVEKENAYKKIGAGASLIGGGLAAGIGVGKS